MPGTRKLGRPTSHRMSMLRGMVTFLLEKGRIETTVTRAKEVSALTDKMITLGKENTLASKRQALSFLKKEAVVYKLFTLIAPHYEERNGGYTRVLKTGPRRGDGAEMAIIELVDADAIYAPKKTEKDEKKEDKKPAKKTSAKKAAKPAEKASVEETVAEPAAETEATAPVEETATESAAETEATVPSEETASAEESSAE